MTSYIFEAQIVRWVDGDTLWLDVTLPFRLAIRSDFRLYGVDTPERKDAVGWKAATDFVNATAPAGSVVTLESRKDPDKYGRWLATITLPNGKVLNDLLVQNGLAVPYFGGTKTAA